MWKDVEKGPKEHVHRLGFWVSSECNISSVKNRFSKQTAGPTHRTAGKAWRVAATTLLTILETFSSVMGITLTVDGRGWLWFTVYLGPAQLVAVPEDRV